MGDCWYVLDLRKTDHRLTLGLDEYEYLKDFRALVAYRLSRMLYFLFIRFTAYVQLALGPIRDRQGSMITSPNDVGIPTTFLYHDGM